MLIEVEIFFGTLLFLFSHQFFPVETHILLFLVAIVATAINSIAGGGGLLTFPVLMTVLPPVTADATSAVALLPAYMTST